MDIDYQKYIKNYGSSAADYEVKLGRRKLSDKERFLHSHEIEYQYSPKRRTNHYNTKRKTKDNKFDKKLEYIFEQFFSEKIY